MRVYYNDYGNHRNNTKGTRFSSGRPELKYNEIFRVFFCGISALIFVLFIGVFDGSVLLYFSTFQICRIHRKRDMGH